MKFFLFHACFLIIHKRIKFVSHSLQSSLPAQILSALINTMFKQFRDVCDSDTAVLQGIISKSDKVNDQF